MFDSRIADEIIGEEATEDDDGKDLESQTNKSQVNTDNTLTVR